MTLRVVELPTKAANPSVGYPTEAALRAAESDHRVANSLAVVSGLLRLQAAKLAADVGKLSGRDAADLLVKAGARVEIIAQLHRRLADEGADGDVDAAQLVRRVAEDTVAALSSPGRTRLILAIRGACPAPQRVALPIGLIVGELMANSLRHAHPTGVAGIIEVSCRCSACGEIHVEVADDGVGLPERFDPRQAETLGLRLVRAFAKQIDGHLTFSGHAIGLSVRLVVAPGDR